MMSTATPSIYWLLVGPRDVASSRIHGYRIHEYLRTHGWKSELVVTPLHWLKDTPLSPAEIRKSGVFRNGDVVVFQKLRGPITVSVLQMLRDEGVSTVVIDSDYPLKLREAQCATITVCPSDYLAQAYREEGIPNVVVIPDGYEVICAPNKRSSSNQKLRCVWFGSMDAFKEIEVRWLRKLISDHFPDFELLVISDYPEADVKWDTARSWDLIKDCDVVVITGSDYFWMQAKSANRITQAMALGLPVVAYPLPAYQRVIRHGRNGILSRTTEDWINALAGMRNPDLRKRIARTGYRYARRYFGPESIGQQWTTIFSRIGTPRPASQSLLHAALSDLRLRRLRSWAFRGMAASFAPMIQLRRSYRVQGLKAWIR